MNQAVITGSTAGIGEAIARRLAGDGLTVTVVGRSAERADGARRRIEAAVPGADLRTEVADLSLLGDVRKLAGRIDPDVFVANAAVVISPAVRTAEGLPLLLTVNHLAPYLLLRTLAERGRPARLVIVGADPTALTGVPVDLDDLPCEHVTAEDPSFVPFVAYGRTKNMNAMTGYALARRAARGITVNGAHPGVISGTELGRHSQGALKAFADEQKEKSPGPDVGADTPSWLATAPEVRDVTGRFFVARQEVDTAPHTTDRERCDRLWAESARWCDLRDS